jgi:glyoxylase-like metal-dependent hydrolase (beta-lactamase superfamily II)
MHQIVPDLFVLRGFPRYAINVYLMGDVLLDAGSRYASARILHQLRGWQVQAHALTHVHADHQGASHDVCQALALPLWCSATESTAMERGDLSKQHPRNWVTAFQERWWAGPAHPVARALREGDVVGGFTVIETPGHSPGHLAYWRESDRTLVLGDVLVNLNFFTGQPRLSEPPRQFTLNATQNRASARKLAALAPSVVCFGHGPPVYDGQKVVEFIDRLT